MTKQKREKFTASTTPEKTRPEKPLVQIQRELTETQLEVIIAGAVWRQGLAN